MSNLFLIFLLAVAPAGMMLDGHPPVDRFVEDVPPAPIADALVGNTLYDVLDMSNQTFIVPNHYCMPGTDFCYRDSGVKP